MSATTLSLVSSAAVSSRIESAARRLFAAELALHDAHRTEVDAWIAAAADKLHIAIEEHTAALYATAA